MYTINSRFGVIYATNIPLALELADSPTDIEPFPAPEPVFSARQAANEDALANAYEHDSQSGLISL